MRLDNDIPGDSCQGCLNTTQKQLLSRAGDHFKELWKRGDVCKYMPLWCPGKSRLKTSYFAQTSLKIFILRSLIQRLLDTHIW